MNYEICSLCGGIKLHAGCCKYSHLAGLMNALAIATVALPIQIASLKESGLMGESKW